MAEKIYERGTLGWAIEQQKKKIERRNKEIEKWKKCGLLNIFQDKGFNDEDREDWYRFWNKVDIRKNKEECWNYTLYISPGGYAYCRYSPYNPSSDAYAHRIAYMLSKGAIADGLQTQHTCNNRRCCNPNHLELGDDSKNMVYMYRCRRRDVTGENNNSSILTENQVREIHKIHVKNPNLKQRQIAEIFEITQECVSMILNGKRWHSIYEEFDIKDH